MLEARSVAKKAYQEFRASAVVSQEFYTRSRGLCRNYVKHAKTKYVTKYSKKLSVTKLRGGVYSIILHTIVMYDH